MRPCDRDIRSIVVHTNDAVSMGSAHSIVTGGAGFIGSHLCDALLARGDVVTCVDNLAGTGGSTRNVDHLLDHERFCMVVEDVVEWAGRASLDNVGCVFHLAASKNSVCADDPERDLSVNALGTLRLLLAAARDGVAKFVHASTGSVGGEAETGVPVSYYGTSKLAAESYCRVVGRQSGLDYTVLRFYHVIGPRQDGSATGGVVPIFVRQALAGEPLTIDGDGGQRRSFTSVHDVVRACLLAAVEPGLADATLTCASGISVSITELAEFVIEETGSHSEIIHAPPRPGDIRRFSVDNSRMRRLGLAFDTDWQAMVSDVIASSTAMRAA